MRNLNASGWPRTTFRLSSCRASRTTGCTYDKAFEKFQASVGGPSTEVVGASQTFSYVGTVPGGLSNPRMG